MEQLSGSFFPKETNKKVKSVIRCIFHRKFMYALSNKDKEPSDISEGFFAANKEIVLYKLKYIYP